MNRVYLKVLYFRYNIKLNVYLLMTILLVALLEL